MSDLITLEGYELDGFSLKRSFKRLKKAVKRAPITRFAKKTFKPLARVTKAVAKIAVKTALPLAVTAVSASVGVPIPPSIVKKGINKAARLVKSGKKTRKAISRLALKRAGIKPGKYKSTAQMPVDVRARFLQTRKAVENKAVSLATTKIIKQVAPVIKAAQTPAVQAQQAALNRQQAVRAAAARKEAVKEAEAAEKKQETPSKWTPEQIKAFNESQQRGDDIETSVKKANSATDSPGDLYYKKGLLTGDYADELKILSTKIFSQNPYAGSISLVSAAHVANIIEAYVYSCLKLSEKQNQSLYYTGTTESERLQFFGNIFIRIAYLYFKGYTTEEQARESGLDPVTRDQVWVTISLIRKYAQEDNTGTFNKFWKPFEYKNQIPDSPVSKGFNLPFPLIAAAGVGLLFLIK